MEFGGPRWSQCHNHTWFTWGRRSWLPSATLSPPLACGLKRDTSSWAFQVLPGGTVLRAHELEKERPVSSLSERRSRVPWHRGWALSQSVRAVATSYHRPGGLNRRSCSSQFRRPESKIKVLADGASGGALLWLAGGPLLMASPRGRHSHTQRTECLHVPSYKDTSPTPEGPAPGPPHLQGVSLPNGITPSRASDHVDITHACVGGTKVCFGPQLCACVDQTQEQTGSQPG